MMVNIFTISICSKECYKCLWLFKFSCFIVLAMSLGCSISLVIKYEWKYTIINFIHPMLNFYNSINNMYIFEYLLYGIGVVSLK